MIYENIKPGIFISRTNRFIANIAVNDNIEVCHVKNTGRCRELLIPGAKVLVQESDNPKRKTRFDLISVYKGDMLINMDSQAPNKVFGEWIGKYFKNVTLVRPETKYKNSRFDFYIEADNKKIFAEVKGVTLEENGTAMFPDAPTERGIKHLKELAECINDGYEAYVFFVIQMEKVKCFTPNRKTHPEFADELLKAERSGVKIRCVNCTVSENELKINNFISML